MHRIYPVLSLVLIGLNLTVGIAWSQPTQRSVYDIESEITESIQQALDSSRSVAGLQVAIVQGDSLTYARGFGTRNIRTGAPVTPETGFYIASSTKSFVGMMAALLAEQDSIDLDAPITEYFPELQLDSIGLEAGRISLRDHLAHRTGYQNDQLAFLPPTIGRLSIDRMVHLVSRYSEPHPITFNYRNESYIMAAAAMTRATGGVSWKQLLVDHIFEPLSMSGTTPYMSEAKDREFAHPHGVVNGQVRPLEAKADTNMHAAGGLVSTAPDIGRWLRAMMNEGRLDDQQILPAQAVREALASQIRLDATYFRFKRYAHGFGWYHSDYRGDRLMHHFGGFTGYHAHMSFMPERDLGVVVLANSGTVLPHNIAARIYDLVLQRASDRGYAQGLQEVAEWARGNRVEGEQRRKEWLTPPVTSSSAQSQSIYVGTYVSPKFGTIEIDLEGGELVATYGPKISMLELFRPGVLLVKWSSEDPTIDLETELPDKLMFEVGSQGDVRAMTWVSPRFGDLATFERR